VRFIESPPERLRRTPPGGRRLRTGGAGSVASAWAASGMLAFFAVGLLAGCSTHRGPTPVPASAPGVTPSALPAAPSSGARARNWDEYRLRAGQRLVAANPNGTFSGAVPEPLLAIPVLEIEINGDGSVRRITVQRQPSQAGDTVQRAAPFGDASHLSRPWKFSEVFLFRDDRRFKPRALDQ
jgi:hypothetical protein